MNKKFMKRAIELAKKAKGLTSPNPVVGAVIVKADHIIAEGWHHKAGEDHAEIDALKKVMKKSGIVTLDLDPMLFHNADLYITMEPCTNYGLTPPCVNSIIKANFRKVIIGMKDPNKKVNGKGIKILRKNGMEVKMLRQNSELYDEVRGINQPFIKVSLFDMPYVTLKAGISLDGKIATSSYDSKWITSEKSRADSKKERNLYDAIIVGANTVKQDDPNLDFMGRFKNKTHLRVILDNRLTTDVNSKVYRDKKVLVACSNIASKTRLKKFKNAGIKVKSFGPRSVSVKKLLKFLAKIGVQSVFVEGGAEVNGSFFDAHLKDSNVIDRVQYYIAPKLIGGKKSLSVIGGEGSEKLNKSVDFLKFDFKKIGEDLKVVGIINSY